MSRFGLAKDRDADGFLPGLDGLMSEFRQGREAALARAISIVEDGRPGASELLHALGRTGREPAARIGLTGPPGAGKSTLAALLAEHIRGHVSKAGSEAGSRVGILAVDPSSAVSGGALLGDRIRMADAAAGGVFIRSMASRGAMGGLGGATGDVLEVMEAFGFGWVLVETVGTGQIGTEVAGVADTLVLILVPESGDTVQAMKAGVAELADVIVVNKADRPGAETLAAELRSAIEIRAPSVARARGHSPSSAQEPGGWVPPVVLTEGTSGKGTDEVLAQIERHRAHLEAHGELERRRRERAAGRIRTILDREMSRRADELLSSVEPTATRRILEGSATPRSIAEELIHRIVNGERASER